MGWDLLGEDAKSCLLVSSLSHCPLGNLLAFPPSHRKLSDSWRQKGGTSLLRWAWRGIETQASSEVEPICTTLKGFT